MISKVSFGSAFKVTQANNNKDAFCAFRNFAYDKEIQNNVEVETSSTVSSPYMVQSCECTMYAPDSLDDEIERFCKYNGISYTKCWKQNSSDMTDKIAPDATGKMTVNIDSQELENLIKNQKSNFEQCKKYYDKYYRIYTDFVLKYSKKVPTATLSITPRNTSVNGFINNFEHPSEDQLTIDFKEDMLCDYCQFMYFAFKESGMKYIPMYMDNDTYYIAQALGLTE